MKYVRIISCQKYKMQRILEEYAIIRIGKQSVYLKGSNMRQETKEMLVTAQEKTRELFKDRKLEEAAACIRQAIEEMEKDPPVSEDEECICFDFKTAMEEVIYRQEEKPKKKVRLAEAPVSNAYLISGSIAMELKDYATALKRLEQAMDWNPINPEIAFEYAEVVKRMGSVDQFLELTRRIFPHIYSPSQLAHAYRNVGYYFEKKDMWSEAVGAFMFSLGYETVPTIQQELMAIAKEKGDQAKAPALADFEEICKANDIPFGPDPELVGLAISHGMFFLKEKDGLRGEYFLRIAHGLTKDPKIAELLQAMEQQKKEAEE